MDDRLSPREQERRKRLSDRARATVIQTYPILDEDETSVTLGYNGFYLQIAFSECHPLMVFYLARGMERTNSSKDRRLLNELNLHSVLGSRALNGEVGCYSYRAAHWIDAELTTHRLSEILGRCADEAERGYARLAQA